MIRRPPRSPPFPSTPLFRTVAQGTRRAGALSVNALLTSGASTVELVGTTSITLGAGVNVGANTLNLRTNGAVTQSDGVLTAGDRKSTRLNSSHANISYAVFC